MEILYSDIKKQIEDLAKKRILFLDGAMGTMLQRYKLQKEDFDISNIFTDVDKNISQEANSEVLCFTRPDILEEIWTQYFLAGADLLTTNSFNSNKISLKDYALEDKAYILAKQNAFVLKNLKDKLLKKYTNRVCFVCGSIGPTNKSASISENANNPELRAVYFDELYEAYTESISGLVDGGVDLLILETSFDTLNVKAAIKAYIDYFDKNSKPRMPLMISASIADSSGRILSGQTVEAFYESVKHADPLSIGLNCSLGADLLLPYLQRLSSRCEVLTSCYPNAGLPNPLSETGYDHTPEITANFVEKFAQEKLTNIIGGCCGTSPEHIKQIVNTCKNYDPRKVCKKSDTFCLAGLDLFSSCEENSPFIVVGERTNVMGSPKFKRLIKENNFDEALYIAREQIEKGANIIDINFDEALLDGKECMKKFLNLIGSEPDIAKVPFMIDSSDWNIIKEGLKSVQGKCIVNSLSLKEGEQKFIQRAKYIKNMGAALIVMAFDENGQACSKEDKISICQRAYKLLESINFPRQDIIFDLNVLTIATGIKEHSSYALNFIEAIKQIKETCPFSKISGGISNLSFSFRGNNPIREAMHTVFMYLAIKQGLDMAIVNAGMLGNYEDIDLKLRTLVENVILNKSDKATEELLDYASKNADTLQNQKKQDESVSVNLSPQEKVSNALIKGNDRFIKEDILEVLKLYNSPLEVIDQVLMKAMNEIGVLFGEGKMFLPQVVKSARVMKKATQTLEPFIQGSDNKKSKRPKILIATVQGDVHDIGKNIVSVVLSCNNFEIFDLGVMTPAEKILEKTKEIKPDVIGLSGLITPSLKEMENVLKLLEQNNINIPVMIGGATTTKLHTAIKLAPLYSGIVECVADASLSSAFCNGIIFNYQNQANEIKNQQEILKIKNEENLKQKEISSNNENQSVDSQAKSQNNICQTCDEASNIKQPENVKNGIFEFERNLLDLEDKINWTNFIKHWESSSAKKEEKQTLINNAKKLLLINRDLKVKAIFGIFDAKKEKENIIVKDLNGNEFSFFTPLQNINNGQNISLSSFIPNKNAKIGLFALTSGKELEKRAGNFKEKEDIYNYLSLKILAICLAEAMAEILQERFSLVYKWGRVIRPAIGYSSVPRHEDKKIIWDILDCKNTIQADLTSSYMMNPLGSICGLYISHPNAKYLRDV